MRGEKTRVELKAALRLQSLSNQFKAMCVFHEALMELLHKTTLLASSSAQIT